MFSIDNESDQQQDQDSNEQNFGLMQNKLIPIIPLKDVVVFPNMVIPLFVGRKKSIVALEATANSDNMVLLLSQKDTDDKDVAANNLNPVGTLAKVLQTLKLPDGTNKILIEGKTRARATKIVEQHGYLAAYAEPMVTNHDIKTIELEALKREIIQRFVQYNKITQKIPEEITSLITKIDNIEQLTDVITTHIISDLHSRQEFLELNSIKKRLTSLLDLLNREIEIFTVEKRIQGRVKQQIEKTQKEYYLHEQAKAIRQELGGDEEDIDDLEELTEKIKKAKMPKEAHEKANLELKKLRLMPPMSSESAIIRNYLEHLISLPWHKTTKVNNNLQRAQKVLDKDHYGLIKIKERIIEYLAVQKRTENNKAPILCFVGPPGVGKTSLGESIAKATGRKYVRVALGGLHDEAEIRGHRKTYIGAMPGKILQNIAKCGVRNPLFLLDEIDKLGHDHRGDPASALLEVLDPEQNKEFVDNYAETAFDLSQVMFVATANSLNIPSALRDRMEIIMLSGYTEGEKLKIAHEYLVPKQIKNNGLKPSELKLQNDSLLEVIRRYTAEAGIRNLERQIGKICRKVVTKIDTQQTANAATTINSNANTVASITNNPQDNSNDNKNSDIGKNISKATGKRGLTTLITTKNLQEYLGVYQYDYGVKSQENRVGRVTGLAWTEVGGDILTIEALAVSGKGNTIHTGHLGTVMKESIQAAISLVRNRASTLGIDCKFYESKDLHVHVPEGAIPKDGPSAGVAMVTAIASSLNAVPIKSSVAMTGEVTLYGDVLPIGGLKEKLLAALRAGIKTVLIPHKNIKDLEEIPEEIKNNLEIKAVKTVDEVLTFAFEYSPKPFIANDGTQALSDDKDTIGHLAKSPIAKQATVKQAKRTS